jgi:hypothetical protein
MHSSAHRDTIIIYTGILIQPSLFFFFLMNNNLLEEEAKSLYTKSIQEILIQPI